MEFDIQKSWYNAAQTFFFNKKKKSVLIWLPNHITKACLTHFLLFICKLNLNWNRSKKLSPCSMILIVQRITQREYVETPDNSYIIVFFYVLIFKALMTPMAYSYLRATRNFDAWYWSTHAPIILLSITIDEFLEATWNMRILSIHTERRFFQVILKMFKRFILCFGLCNDISLMLA